MRGFRKQAFHDTSVMQKRAGVSAEELADFAEGDPVMTVDGFPGRVTAVLFGPYQGTESYQVELDGGMGGGDYSPGQLKPIRRSTASREVEASEFVVASIPTEASTDHTANVDYPELEDILERRLPNENLRFTAAVNKDNEADEPDSSSDDSGENLEQQSGDVEDPEGVSDDPDANPVNENNPTNAQVGDVTPPSACSNCGGSSFGDPQMTGRGVRMRCDQCKATMTSWGGQWQPEFPNSSQNHASEQGDYRSGGVGGVANAPGAQVPGTTDGEKKPDSTKTSAREIFASMTNPELAESLQAEAGIVQYMFNRLYQKAREKERLNNNEWWVPTPNEVQQNNAPLQGEPQYQTIQPHYVTVGSVSQYDDPDWKWHFVATWMDVQAKARKIRKENHVKIVAASSTFVTAEVKGDIATYETQLNYVPGTKKVADWACGCKWASYAWGRAKRYARFEGRLCSHALATQYEASSRGIFGKDVGADTHRPDWQKAHSPVVVQYDKGQGRDLTRRAVPPANMKRTFSSVMIDSEGVYPQPQALDLAHPPIYASVQTMVDNKANLVDVIEMLASMDVEASDAKSMVFEALATIEVDASKQHRHHPKTRQEHGNTWGYGYGPRWGFCGLCGGSGCTSCNGTGQVLDSDGDFDGGAVDAGGVTASGPSQYDAFDFGHEMGYDYADQKHAYDNGMSNVHPGDFEGAKHNRANSWHGPESQRDHVIDGFEHGHATFNNEVESGLPHHGGSIKTAVVRKVHIQTEDMKGDHVLCGARADAHENEVPDLAPGIPGGIREIGCPECRSLAPKGVPIYGHGLLHKEADFASADPFSGGAAGGYNVSVPHSNSENPGSTGWATSQDPGDWGKSLISNNFGVTFDAALHVTALKEGEGSTPTVSGVALKAADTGRVLMIQRGNDDPKDPARGTWEFPGGHHEADDQTSLHAGIREWEEETGHPFPAGGHVTHVHRSGPYALHTVVIPSEGHVDFSKGRLVENPDGDHHEQSAWWDPSHASKNPALRSELKKSNPFGDIKKAADLGEGDESDMSAAAADFEGRMMDRDPSSLNETPEPALPSTTGDDGQGEDEVPDDPAGDTRDGEHGNRTFDTTAAIVADFQRSAGAKLLKQSMKDFSFDEQQDLINEGKGDRARNFSDLKVAGTHYELIGDDADDETILWV